MSFIDYHVHEMSSVSNSSSPLNIYLISRDNYDIDDIYENSIIDIHESFNSLMEAMTIYELSEKANLIAINEDNLIKRFFDGLLNILKKAWNAVKSIFSKSKDNLDKKIATANKKIEDTEKKEEIDKKDTIEIILKNVNKGGMSELGNNIDSIFRNINFKLKRFGESTVDHLSSLTLPPEATEGYDKTESRYDKDLDEFSKYIDYCYDYISDSDSNIKETLSYTKLVDRISDANRYYKIHSNAFNETKKIFDICKHNVIVMRRVVDRTDFTNNKNGDLIKSLAKDMQRIYSRSFQKILLVNRYYLNKISEFHSAYTIALSKLVGGKDNVTIDFKEDIL